MNPTSVPPVVYEGSRGTNDAQSVVKLKSGFVPWAVNLFASGDTWDRRQGRDFYLLESGFVLGISTVRFEDGQVFNIAQIGASLYNLSETFSYLMAAGVKLYIQSADLNYWDVTPDATTGLINPVVVAAPAAAAQTANFTVLNGESFGFIGTSGGVTRLNCTQDQGGWFLTGYGSSTATSTISTDMVFTAASGFSFRIADYTGNTWKFQISNDGSLSVITV